MTAQTPPPRSTADSPPALLGVPRTVLGAAVLFVLINALITGQSIQSLVEAHADVAESARVQLAAQSLAATLGEAEAAHRGYLAGGLDTDLTMFQEERALVRPALDGVLELCRDRPWTEDVLVDLREETESWLVSRPEDVVRRPPGEDVVRLSQQRARSAARLARLDKLFDRLEELENEHLEEARSAVSRTSWRVRVMVLLQAGLALALLVSVGRLGARERRQAERAAVELSRQVEEQTQLLRERAEALDTTLAARDKAFEDLSAVSEELERSNRELNDFAFIASHDLQEPLRKIRAFANLVNERYRETLDERGQDYLRRLASGAERMASLIDDLLRLSRVSRNAPKYEDVRLRVLLEDTVDLLELQIDETHGEVVLEGAFPTLEADPGQLGQLLQNLIGNGLKFHRPDLPPRVVVTGAEATLAGQPALQLTIADNGIGIEPEYRERVFGAFQRLHGRSEYEGTGIGLAVVRRVVERHSGTIRIDSTPGGGTTMVVVLPLSAPADSTTESLV